MFLTRSQLRQAAQDIRSAEAALAATVQELQHAGVWSGADADRFQRDWNDHVRGRLLGAAVTLDGVAFVTVV